jgi:hypothetical protein
MYEGIGANLYQLTVASGSGYSSADGGGLLVDRTVPFPVGVRRSRRFA